MGIASPLRRTLRWTIQRRYPFRRPGPRAEVFTVVIYMGDHEADQVIRWTDPGDHDASDLGDHDGPALAHPGAETGRRREVPQN